MGLIFQSKTKTNNVFHHLKLWLLQRKKHSSKLCRLSIIYSKFVEESGLPCAALLLRAIDFGAALLESESDLRSCLKSRIETVVHVNYDDTELENKVLNVTLNGRLRLVVPVK